MDPRGPSPAQPSPQQAQSQGGFPGLVPVQAGQELPAGEFPDLPCEATSLAREWGGGGGGCRVRDVQAGQTWARVLPHPHPPPGAQTSCPPAQTRAAPAPGAQGMAATGTDRLLD